MLALPAPGGARARGSSCIHRWRRQAPHFRRRFSSTHDGYERNEAEGLDARGSNALNGLYEAADGWLVIADADWDALTNMPRVQAFGGAGCVCH